MISSRFKVCELFGIPIYLDFSFAILLLLMVLQFGSLAMGVGFVLMLTFSIVLHELGHSLTARAFGYPTNSITVSLLGGCASLRALPRKGYQEFLTAVAGPAVSFLLAGIGAVLVTAVQMKGGFVDALAFIVSNALQSFGVSCSFGRVIYIDPSWRWLVNAAVDLSLLNMVLGLFNLLPGFPMDGGRIFRSFMRLFASRTRATYVAMLVGRVTAVSLGLVGLYRIVNGRSWGFVTCLIAWMIWREGYREYLLVRQEEDLRNWTQADFNARVSPPPYDREP